METTKRWLAHYPKEVPPSYAYPKHNAAQLLIDAAERYPSRPALDFLGARYDYARLLEASYRFANALQRRFGIRRGDRVAIMLPNCPAAVIAFYGTLMAGAVAVQTNPLYQPHELKHQLADSGAKLIVTLDQLYARVDAARPYTNIEHVVVTSIADELPWPKSWLYPLKLKRSKQYVLMTYTDTVHRFKDVLAESLAAPILARVDAEEELAALQYTGGTTGVAKGVMLTHYNLVANTHQNALWCYRAKMGEERFLAALPLFHVFGLTVLMCQAALRAGELILLPRFEIETVLGTIHAKKPTIFPGAPTMYIALINHPKLKAYDLSSVNVCVSGAAPLPLEVQERFEALSGARLIEGYGMTEASPVTHANPIWGMRKVGSVGIPFPDTDCKVVDPETGEELPVGAVGEIAVRGPQVMKGYWNRPEETEKVLRDGWLFTGDMGTMDEDGYFKIVDRKKDIIIASGFNVYPREIEEVLFQHPGVKEAVVAGVPDPYRGETVKAYVVLQDGAEVTAAALEAYCREHLAAYKVPRLIEFRAELPKSMIGKPLRRALVEEERAKR
ncbi:long-chain fatty acid--CoA ligase [Paenibacillus sp.]|uniref:long-chain-fatty-acid--CoA ligase n=1 Tax=Paenibacillus sp. TaxID=58172 RepID=UPI002D2DB75F|nr:long-chain fatty acid--CoA ligase [Paenibacillus sp.]HZG88349.1 long-chain fatty acid--CoA ligase [Paenibacillus sp.]